jgi:hypothetical protein
VIDGYLVLAVCNFDDIPIQFFMQRPEAVKAAKSLGPPSANPLGSMGITGFLGAKVLRFKKGKPVGKTSFFEAIHEPDDQM